MEKKGTGTFSIHEVGYRMMLQKMCLSSFFQLKSGLIETKKLVI